MDDDSPSPPILFANRVFRQLVDHLVGDDMIMLPHDYTVMRMVFRAAHGSWEQAVHGNIQHLRLLAEIVKAWGAMPGRKRRSEMG